MNVKLVNYSDEGEIIAALAAKLTHEPDGCTFEELYDKCVDPDCGCVSVHGAHILKHCIKMGHESILEHLSFTFYIEDVSRALTHQLVRHRMASYSQQSQRHVNMDDCGFVVDDLSYIEDKKKRDEVESYLMGEFNHIRRVYIKLVNEYGLRKEDARSILPNATTTKIIVTMNARELRHFFRLRIHPHAQREIMLMASQMLYQANWQSPLFFEDLMDDKFIKEKIDKLLEGDTIEI